MKFEREYVTIDEVYDAYYDCCKHKGSTPGCIEYQMNYIANNYQLYIDLNSMEYEISKSNGGRLKSVNLPAPLSLLLFFNAAAAEPEATNFTL